MPQLETTKKKEKNMDKLNPEMVEAMSANLDDLELYIKSLRGMLDSDDGENKLSSTVYYLSHIKELADGMVSVLHRHCPEQMAEANESFPPLNRLDAPKM